MKKIVEGLPFERANWKFNGELVDSFDKHIAKSVFYQTKITLL
jgi:hypothetical protein